MSKSLRNVAWNRFVRIMVGKGELTFVADVIDGPVDWVVNSSFLTIFVTSKKNIYIQ